MKQMRIGKQNVREVRTLDHRLAIDWPQPQVAALRSRRGLQRHQRERMRSRKESRDGFTQIGPIKVTKGLFEAPSSEGRFRSHQQPMRRVVVELAGEIDVSNVDRLTRDIDDALDGGANQITLDVRDLNFIDSYALAVIVALAHRVRDLALRSPNDAITRILEVTGLAQIFRTIDAEPGADEGSQDD